MHATIKDVSHLINLFEYRISLWEEHRKQLGLDYNLFEVLDIHEKEVILHTRFIADLLNPKGAHHLGNVFGKTFGEELAPLIEEKRRKGIDIKAFDFSAISNLSIEFSLGPVHQDDTQGGSIDILLRDKNGQSVIIENKIYARNQPINYSDTTIIIRRPPYIPYFRWN
jgi:hypothetical protein